MKFSSSHRRSDGRLETLEIEAESRAEAVRKLRAMGVVSLELKEVRGQGLEVRGQRSRRNVVLAVAGVAVLIGIGVWFYSPQISRIPQKQAGKTTSAQPAEAAGEKKSASAELKKTVETKPVRQALREEAPAAAPPPVARERKFGEGGRPVFTNTTALARKDKFDVFKHRAEFEMAALAMIKPGEAVIGDAHYGRGFMKSLKECLDEPIAIDEADDAEVNELKRSVTEMKEQVRGMLARGEDVGQTFAAARRELQELGIYRMGVEANLKEMLKSKDVLSERDMDDCIRAANTLLEEKGIAPVRMSPLTRHLLKRRIERQNKAKQTVE